MIKLNSILCVTAIIAILSNIAIDFFSPSLPFIAKDLSSSYIQLSVSVYLIGAGLGQLVYGPLSDYYGRKNILLAGITISILGCIGCVCAHNIFLLLSGRFVQGLGLASCLLMIRSILFDSYDKKNISQMYSFISICMEGATLAAPVIGGYIQLYYNWRMNFIFFTLLSILSLILVFFYLAETNKNRLKLSYADFANECIDILRDRSFISYTLCSTFAASGIYIYLSISPFLFQKTFGLSVIEYSYTAFLVSGALVLGGIINSILVIKRDIDTLIYIGGALMFLSGIVILTSLALAKIYFPCLLISTFLYMLGAALVFPNALVGALGNNQTTIGTATSLYGACQMIGAFLLTFLVSFTNVNDPTPLALANTLLGGILIMVLYSLKEKELILNSTI